MLNYMERTIMTLWASCGHSIGDGEQEFVIQTKETVNDYDLERTVNCVCQQVVCLDCYKFYLREHLILETQEEIDEWMKG